MKSKYIKLISLLILGLCISFLSLGSVTDDYKINDDSRIIYLVHQFEDKDLFKNDIMAEYTKSSQAPITTTLLYFYGFINNHLDFIVAGKILSIVLFLAAVIYSYRLGEVIDKKTAFIFSLLVTLQMGITYYYFSGGLSRAFGWPLSLAFMYYLIKDSKLKMLIILIMQSLFYPPAFLISFGTYFLLNLHLQKFDFKKYKTLFLTAIIPLSILILSFANKKNFGQMTNIFEAIAMPEYYTGGRVPVFRGSLPFTDSIKDTIYSIFNYQNTGISNPIYLSSLVIFGIIGLIFLLYYGKKLLPKELHYMALVSVLAFATAFALFFYLYFPNRYISFTIPIYIFAATSAGLSKLLDTISSKKIKGLLLLSVIILYLVFFVPKIPAAYTICGDKDMYATISALDKQAIIAGHPKELDCIPIFTKHTVIFMDELTAPYHKEYYKVIKNRLNAFFSAYYSDDIVDMYAFCKKYNVSYVIINRDHFTYSYLNGRIYREPFNIQIKEQLSNKNDFALSHYGGKTIFDDETKYIINC